MKAKTNVSRQLRVGLIVCVMLLVAAAAYCAKRSLVDNDEIAIAISPATLALSSAGGSVSVHTNIPFSAVDAGSLALDELAADYAKADNCGYLVVKFDIDAVKAMVAAPEATLTLTGTMNDGTAFSAVDTIAVIE